MDETRLSPTRYNVGVYSVLEAHLRNAKDPLTCVDMLDFEDVRRFTEDSNRLSNYLGHMWRKGLLIRHAVPAAHLSMARYAYTWRHDAEAKQTIERPSFVLKGKQEDLDVQVERTGNTITIEHAAFRLTLQLKQEEPS